MKIAAFIHPGRTALPCTGVGRHINGVLSALSADPAVSLELLFAREWLSEGGRLAGTMPLRDLPFRAFPGPENRTERLWKLIGRPRMDRYLPSDADWVYCPMETCFPVSKIPVAITIHDVHPFEPDLPADRGRAAARLRWSLWVRRAVRRSAVVFTVSEFSKGRIVELLGADPGKVVVVGNGVAPEFFDGPGAAPVFDRPYALVVGGLRRIKGGREVLAVARQLRARGSPLRIVVAGGPNDPGLFDEANAIGHVHFTGPIDDANMRNHLYAAASLLFLSLYEGFGIPAIEAMAAGVPVVAADRAALPETVGDAGLLVDPAAASAIAEILDRLRSNSPSRERIVAAGRKRAFAFTWEAAARRVVAGLEAAGRD